MNKKYLLGAAYALGDEPRHYLQIDDFEQLAQSRQVETHPQFMGFDAFFAAGDIFECARQSVLQTLQKSGVAPALIDHVVFCSTYSQDPFFERNRKIGRLLSDCGIQPRSIRGISCSGCVDLLSSIDIVCAMLDQGQGENILIVDIECIAASDDRRLLDHALLSDAVVSLVVSSRAPGGDAGFEILGTAIASNVEEIGKDMAITSTSPDRGFVRRLLDRFGLQVSDVAKVFGNNVFLPIKTGREALMGFTRAQMHLDNVRRTGHCLGCDTVINLLDFNTEKAPGHFVLYAEAEGHAGAVLLAQR